MESPLKLDNRQKELFKSIGQNEHLYECLEIVKTHIADIRFGEWSNDVRVASIRAIEELLESPARMHSGKQTKKPNNSWR